MIEHRTDHIGERGERPKPSGERAIGKGVKP
jgi:hypothetical protein